MTLILEGGKLSSLSSMVKKTHPRYTHFNTSDQVESFVKLACAQGNYHCDVVYCKDGACTCLYFVSRPHLMKLLRRLTARRSTIGRSTSTCHPSRASRQHGKNWSLQLKQQVPS